MLSATTIIFGDEADTPLLEPVLASASFPIVLPPVEYDGFQLSDGKAYINPCSTDDTQSTMYCNVLAAPGTCGVHMPSTGQLPADAVTKIQTWLKCGAPNN